MRKKFLFIRFSSIGDIILTTPLVRSLRQRFPEAEIHFVTKSQYRELLTDNPYIDTIHCLNSSMQKLVQTLKAENFDYIFDLHHNLRSQWLKMKLGVPSRSFNKLNLRKWLLVNLKINSLPDLHIVDRYFATMADFGISPDSEGLNFFISPGVKSGSADLPFRFREGYIALIISGTYYTKQLPAEKVIEICRSISYPVVLIGGDREKSMGMMVKAETGDHVLNLAGMTTLTASAALIRDARLVLTNDTGMMHIAAAFQKKILSFWGNTVPAFGMYPYKPDPDSKIMEVKGLWCRPCSKLGYKQCPLGHFRCMKEMDVTLAVRWINHHFGESAADRY